MAYALNTSPTLETIPQLAIDFATQVLGWSELEPGVIAAPGADPGVGFKLTMSRTGSTERFAQYILAEMTRDGVRAGENTAICPSPYIKLAFQEPTRLYMFGALSPTPFLALVIEYAPGFYRHMYIGYMERLGNYTGSEVTAGSAFYIRANGSSWYNDDSQRYLFSASPYAVHINTADQIRLVHADLGGEMFASFRTVNRDSSTLLPTGRVLGGFRDNINDAMIARGQNTFAGNNFLVPVNMYLTMDANRVQPIGRPAGVRMVNMTNLDPAVPINVGGKLWRCFPQFRKNAEAIPNAPSGTPNYYQEDETSYIIGYAYLED